MTDATYSHSQGQGQGQVVGQPRWLLQLEGALILVGATWAYGAVVSRWGLFALLLLAPDLFMLGYLVGPRVGAIFYNLGHTFLLPALLLALGLVLAMPLFTAIALIWIAHIGMDRAAGYGLKYPLGFHNTHLSGPRLSPLSER